MKPAAATRVMVGVSESLAGLAALRYAVAEARRRGSVLHAVRAWQFAVAWRGDDAELCRDGLALEAAMLVRRAFDNAMGGVPTDITIMATVREGVAGTILPALASRDDDVLVVGGPSQRRWLLPRVTRHCLRRASCPVIVVAPPVLARARHPRALVRQLRREVRRGGAAPTPQTPRAEADT